MQSSKAEFRGFSDLLSRIFLKFLNCGIREDNMTRQERQSRKTFSWTFEKLVRPGWIQAMRLLQKGEDMPGRLCSCLEPGPQWLWGCTPDPSGNRWSSDLEPPMTASMQLTACNWPHHELVPQHGTWKYAAWKERHRRAWKKAGKGEQEASRMQHADAPCCNNQ